MISLTSVLSVLFFCLTFYVGFDYIASFLTEQGIKKRNQEMIDKIVDREQKKIDEFNKEHNLN